jgi:glucose-6-phosphate 1-dehydrogenase
MQVRAPKCAIIILGATGDLTRRKLVPALHELYRLKKLHPGTLIAGSGRRGFTDAGFRRLFDAPEAFKKRLFYHQGISGLKTFVRKQGRYPRVLFFLALPPAACAPAAAALAREGFGPEAALVVEKPFGSDLASARALNRALLARFNEKQIFRIDHYLAKEAVQNILVFRFANAVFEPVWSCRHIESIQINALETEGVLDRGAYFDRAGIIRDMVQNHLTQLLCLLTMDAPRNLGAEEIRRRKMKVLSAMRVEKCFRGQYRGYQAEKGVDRTAQTETFAEMRLSIRNRRWKDTAVYLRTGKALNRKGTEIGVRFRRPPRALFGSRDKAGPNQIVFKIQPAEGIILDLSSKVPGSGLAVTRTRMNFCYREAFKGPVPEAYRRLLMDAIQGDRTLFVGARETEASWKVYEGILDKGGLACYRKGGRPPDLLAAPWIDFASYGPACA